MDRNSQMDTILSELMDIIVSNPLHKHQSIKIRALVCSYFFSSLASLFFSSFPSFLPFSFFASFFFLSSSSSPSPGSGSWKGSTCFKSQKRKILLQKKSESERVLKSINVFQITEKKVEKIQKKSERAWFGGRLWSAASIILYLPLSEYIWALIFLSIKLWLTFERGKVLKGWVKINLSSSYCVWGKFRDRELQLWEMEAF